jgi:hypothetical protein
MGRISPHISQPMNSLRRIVISDDRHALFAVGTTLHHRCGRRLIPAEGFSVRFGEAPDGDGSIA